MISNTKNNNVLLVGNGFDLAHGLDTKYEDFLFVLKNWNRIYEYFKNQEFSEEKKDIDVKIINKYSSIMETWDSNNIDRLNDIILKNSWIYYYCNCGAEIDQWIDFEREIYPVIDLFDFVFNSTYIIHRVNSREYAQAHIERHSFSPNMIRIAELWQTYFDTSLMSVIVVNLPFVSVNYGILKKKILLFLRKEFDEFILAFEIYLHEFVYKKTNIKLLKQIKEIGINSVISFNYTLTESLYGVKREKVHHLHGMIRDDLATGINNMVVGVSEQEKPRMDFIYFVKYFQRIQKGSGVKYKRFARSYPGTDEKQRDILKEYVLYIYGHSLDETDADIIKYLIGDFGVEGINLKPKQVFIFYYDNADYEQKVINLIKLYGRSVVEECMEKREIKFIQTTNEEWCENIELEN